MHRRRSGLGFGLILAAYANIAARGCATGGAVRTSGRRLGYGGPERSPPGRSGFSHAGVVHAGSRDAGRGLPRDGASAVALEPYARLDLGSGFVNARFTVNLGEPIGFAFDEGKIRGAHVGGGLVF